MPRRIEALVEGQHRPVVACPLLSSANSVWSGLLFERHPISHGCASSLVWPVPHIVLVVTGAVRIEHRAHSQRYSFVAGPGSVTLWPGGYEATPITWSGPCETLDVELSGPVLEWLAQDDGSIGPASFTPRFGAQDPHLAALVRCMEADVRAGCPTGRLYGEALSLALAAYVAGHYSIALPSRADRKCGLSEAQLERVLEYVHGRLGSSLSLAELAAVADLSPQHFSVAFRNAMGVSPHRYVVRERIAEAKRQLAARHLTIAQVALSVGFASQSHFTQSFRQVTGTTPRRYQRDC
jgi:AraC family transcriptional regulator